MIIKKKGIITLLLISAVLILPFMAIKLYSDSQQKKVSDAIYETVILSFVQTSSRLDEALMNNDRKKVLMAGVELERMIGLLYSGIGRDQIAPALTFGPGSPSYLAELLIFGDKSTDNKPVGRSGDNTPFTEQEVVIIKCISDALKEAAMQFYSEEASFYDLNKEKPILNSENLKRALNVLQEITTD